jgi:DNA (cytosine-5)-methyltransferase 1
MQEFIDLFAGMGGFRVGFQQACRELGIDNKCILTSEIKPHAITALYDNFPHKEFIGDITTVLNEDIPKFDYLFAGFPCQSFSASGKRNGFADTRGTLFFEIERILSHHNPQGFILENVEGLVRHDIQNKNDKIGRTFDVILTSLKKLGYYVTWKVLDSKDFGIPQSRKRVYIVGSKKGTVDLNNFKKSKKNISDILESGLPTIESDFTKKLLKKYKVEQLHGKSITDKRGGNNNIHSWDIGLKEDCTKEQINLLNQLFKERRKKHWAEKIGIDWADGMALTLEHISTFFASDNLKSILDDLVKKGYLKLEHPKKLVKEKRGENEISFREYDTTKPKGYNIVTGKLSFEVNKILDPNGIAPTLVATDVSKLTVPDGNGIRRLTIREGLRLFGYPESYDLSMKENLAFDLLGNTVVVPVIYEISKRLLS